MNKQIKDRTGEMSVNNIGLNMTIILYINAHNMMIQFDDGTVVKGRYLEFKRGGIKNPNHPSVCGVGYIGQGEYNSSKDKKCYDAWRGMMARCYDDKYIIDFPSYIGCSVDKLWHNFQNFAKWFYSQSNVEKFLKNNIHFELDKDIKNKGNKIYSPDNCSIVNTAINSLLIKCDRGRGLYPIGVSYNKASKSFTAKIRKYKISYNIGYYKTPEEAFYAYKEAKEKHIKEVAWIEYLKGNITEECCRALHLYEVEITD